MEIWDKELYNFLISKGITPEYKGFKPLYEILLHWDYDTTLRVKYEQAGKAVGKEAMTVERNIYHIKNACGYKIPVKKFLYMLASKYLMQKSGD